MIFDADTTKQILAGRKTMVRRRVAGSGQRPAWMRTGNAVPLERPAVGDEIRADLQKAVREGRVRRPSVEVGQLLIGDVRRERHGDIGFADVLAEGCRTTIEYKARWVRRYDRRWVAAQEEMAAEHGDGPVDDDALAERFDDAHADLEVDVVAIRVDRDAPTFLAARSEVGYVHQKRGAWVEEPEAVPSEVVSEQTARARREEGQGKTASWLEKRERIEQEIASFEAEHDLTPAEVKAIRMIRHGLERGDRRFAA